MKLSEEIFMKGWIGMNLDDEVKCCIQHLGAMQGGIGDGALRARVHAVLVKAARRKNMPCAGTALYSLAADRRATPQQLEELKRLTLALCGPDANPAARIAAVQLAGELGERALPFVALGSICWLLLPVLLSDSHFLRGFCRAAIGCAA